MNMELMIWAVLILAFILLLILYRSTKKLIRCLLFGAASGLFSLGILWIAGHFWTLEVAFTPLTLLVSGLFGIPGVAGLLLLPLL